MLLLTGCEATSTTEDGPAGIVILAPHDGDVVCGTPLAVRTEVTGIDLVDPYEPPDPLPARSGHVDVTLNGQDALMTDREGFDLPDVADGEYQLKVELSNADHTPLVPYAGDFVYVTVDAAVCEAAR